MTSPSVSVIISTYNQPDWLALVLHGYALQTVKDIELVIADDGSDERTANTVKAFENKYDISIKHLWQADDGFQKTKILNTAITAASSDYLIVTDGDCIPRKDFVETHLKLRQKNCALSGGYFKLTKAISELIALDNITKQLCFNQAWLISHGQPKTFKMNKLNASPFKAWFLNTFTTTKATFDGMNISCWKQDIIEVNGFDERMKYGGEDREVGERMMNNGIKFLQIRYSAICVHLHHERPYRTNESKSLNLSIRKETKRNKSTYTPFGIIK
ncbi:MAG: glycosyltransferase family 2 protein [Bacteroidota bacterium]